MADGNVAHREYDFDNRIFYGGGSARDTADVEGYHPDAGKVFKMCSPLNWE